MKVQSQQRYPSLLIACSPMLEHENDFVHCKYENQILHITMKNKLPTDEEWEGAKGTILSYYEANIQKKTRFSIIMNMCDLPLLPTYRSRDWIKFLNSNKTLTKQCVLCSSIIIDNSVIQASMNVFFMIYRAERPIQFTKTIEEANQFVAEHQQAN